jgi:lipopolysaccharide transport system ATP-binding protein
MRSTVISVQNVSKRFLIGSKSGRRRRYAEIRDAANLRLAIRHGLISIVDKVTRTVGRDQSAQAKDIAEFWALRNINFEVERGEIVGIIGRNGAGKSTILKILSRITEPSSGRVVLRGRIASLLEVGTGFHPELTGRENIFLNGAILGMSRAEIRKKFAEIVEFAQIGRFIDTPVKHFSSGMYVRLAFSVAAHLEPEVLVVDEVLAVGDSEFQEKCLGRMKDISRSGRTVLLVSHNMSAIRHLASRCLLMSEGAIVFDGSPTDAIGRYSEALKSRARTEASLGSGEHTAIKSAILVDADGSQLATYTAGEPLRLDVMFWTDGGPAFSIEVVVVGADRQKLALASLQGFHGNALPTKSGIYKVRLEIEPLWLASGEYHLDVATSITSSGWDHYVEDASSFRVLSSNRGKQAWDFKQSYGLGSFALEYLRTPSFVRVDSD